MKKTKNKSIQLKTTEARMKDRTLIGLLRMEAEHSARVSAAEDAGECAAKWGVCLISLVCNELGVPPYTSEEPDVEASLRLSIYHRWNAVCSDGEDADIEGFYKWMKSWVALGFEHRN